MGDALDAKTEVEGAKVYMRWAERWQMELCRKMESFGARHSAFLGAASSDSLQSGELERHGLTLEHLWRDFEALLKACRHQPEEAEACRPRGLMCLEGAVCRDGRAYILKLSSYSSSN